MPLGAIPSDLVSTVFLSSKLLIAIVWCRYKAVVWMDQHPTAGRQYRQHIQNGGFRP
jgi:hypothetical protein